MVRVCVWRVSCSGSFRAAFFIIFLRNLALELGFGSRWCWPEEISKLWKKVHFVLMLPGLFVNSTFLALHKGVLGQERSPHALMLIILVTFIWENSNFRDFKGDVWFVQFGREVAGEYLWFRYAEELLMRAKSSTQRCPALCLKKITHFDFQSNLKTKYRKC